MRTEVIVIGAGVGGLSAALRLAKAGCEVRVLEARSEAGGLASGVHYDGFTFDAGPYILLERPGLEWAFENLGLDLTQEVALLPIEDIYEVQMPGASVRFYVDIARTAEGFERQWPGSGKRYERFVEKMNRISRSLRPILFSHPSVSNLIRAGAWMHALFLMKSLDTVLADADLPGPVRESIAIWTHVAGQTKQNAPSPMAFVPTLMHTVGAYYPVGGIRSIPAALERAAVRAGVVFQYGVKVKRIRTERGKVIGIDTEAGESMDSSAVLSNAAALSAYLKLLEVQPPAVRRHERLPLQSPGVCAYMAIRGSTAPPYLRFKLNASDPSCALFIQPGVVNREESKDGWFPARLLAPMDYAKAQMLEEEDQLKFLDGLLNDEWWRCGVTDARVLARRTPRQWGAGYNLYANSMNPVMTAKFMRQGRVAHRSPYVRGLYCAGSSTHPGQWVSFCAISGLLAADCLIEDLNAGHHV